MMNFDNDLTGIHSVSCRDDSEKMRFYYVSDLHLEYQLDLVGKSRTEIRSVIKEKVKELVSDVEDTDFPLLIAGDVADCFDLSVEFYRSLLSCWKGHIIAVLGNHELWDVNRDQDQNVEDIINRYKSISETHSRLHFLENEIMFLNCKSDWECVPEKWLSLASKKKLICDFNSAKMIILGGIGFAGRNLFHNADAGIYKHKLTRPEEIERSEHFCRFHVHVMEASNFNKAIVLTHNPPEDWQSGQLCPDWIYVCGHNHRNRYERKNNGVWILNDNQMGLDPCAWELRSFDFDQQPDSDPLEYLPEGIHEISRKEYIIFNRCFGISMEGFSWEGTVYAIKHSGYYMFMLEGKILYFLNGGKRKRVNHNLEYYDKNMSWYTSQVRKLSTPYYQYMQQLSADVKHLGGTGYIHGCIVDIDVYNHIHCDPKDGKLSFYFARDIIDKLFYPDLRHLIQDSPQVLFRELIIQRLGLPDNELMVLQPVDDASLVVTEPHMVTDTSMYKTSRIMRSFQYVHEQKVIRIWNDELLEYDLDENRKLQETKTYLKRKTALSTK